MNDSFLQKDQILGNVSRLQGIPGVIVHGRYDVVCPLEQAWLLHQAWPLSRLQVIQDAGHSATEPGIVDALVTATEQFARRFR
jgi:proline iminopeptidase